MILNGLGINITKNCNLDCAHCLCGDAKNECITKEVVESAFKGIKRIDELYLTGGEPLLKPEIIRMVIDECKKQNVEVQCISITTNGTIFTDEVKKTLLYIFNGVDADLIVSKDKFHKQSICKKLSNFDKLFIGQDFIYNSLIFRIRDFCLEHKINFDTNGIAQEFLAKMGRAKNIKGAMEIPKKIWALGNYSAKNHLYIDEIIIDTSGHVLKCDYENDEVEDLSIGNILDNTLEELIYNKCISELEQKKIKFKDDKMITEAIDMIYVKANRK